MKMTVDMEKFIMSLVPHAKRLWVIMNYGEILSGSIHGQT